MQRIALIATLIVIIAITGRCERLHRLPQLSESEYLAAAKADVNASGGRGRIINGTKAKHGQFPFVVALWRPRESRPFCGGSLITNNWILTAAHCVYGKSAHSLRVSLGDHNVKKKDAGEKILDVCKVVTHPYYSNHHVKDDIAMIRLCHPVDFSPVIQPVALAEPGMHVASYANVNVAGWGVTSEGGAVSPILMYVGVQNIPVSKCRSAYPWVTSSQICAGLDAGGKDSCQGDSGGPLWWDDETHQRRMLIGIVSHGRGCARPGYPGVYTNVAEYFNWILETMAKWVRS